MRKAEGRRARAFAPGHVTGIFRPDTTAPDPRGRGSRGMGLVLSAGATAEAVAQAHPRSRLSVRDTSGAPLTITEDAVRHLVRSGSGSVSVVVRHDLPVGQGFGMSAAGTLAAALAVARLLRRPARRAVEVAHLAELFGGGGLGGVPAILGGGWELRRTPGIPPWGRIDHGRFPYPIFVGVVGGTIPSPRLLRQPLFLARVEDAARGFDRLLDDPEPRAFLDASEEFTDRLGLAPPPLVRVLRALRRRGWWAAQAMFGRSFFAVAPTDRVRASGVAYLESSRVRAVELAPSRAGAHLLRSPSGGDATILTGRPSRRRP